MLTNFYRTVRACLSGVILTVFFTTSTYSSDSTLYSIESEINDLIYNLSGSVVTVEVIKPVSYTNYFGSGEELVHSMISSGIIYDSLGHIITSAKSVAGSDKIAVHFNQHTLPAKLLGIDYQTGLALLEIDKRIGQPAQISKQYLCGGQLIIALGNAYGLRSSPTLGFCAGVRPEGLIQYSGALTSGTIGGGLFDLTGNLVGIISGSINSPDSPGAGLAIPAHLIPAVVQHILRYGSRLAGFIGITTSEIEISPGIVINLPGEIINVSNRSGLMISRGLLITDIDPNSPAKKAGLMKRDLLFKYNGVNISSAAGLKKEIIRTTPGTIVEIGLIRKNIPFFVKMTIGSGSLNIERPSVNNQANRILSKSSRESLLNEINSLKSALYKLEKKLIRLK